MVDSTMTVRAMSIIAQPTAVSMRNFSPKTMYPKPKATMGSKMVMAGREWARGPALKEYCCTTVPVSARPMRP